MFSRGADIDAKIGFMAEEISSIVILEEYRQRDTSIGQFWHCTITPHTDAARLAIKANLAASSSMKAWQVQCMRASLISYLN